MGLLATASPQLLRMAAAVTERVAELLRAPVMVIDADGAVVASSEAGVSRLLAGQIGAGDDASYLRVPLRNGDWAGEVVVGQPQGDEPISPRLAQVLVEMIVNEAAVLDRLPDQHEVKNQFIYDLLHGQIDDEEQILSQARFLGMDLAPPRAVILIDAADYLLAPIVSRGDSPPDAPAVEERARRQAQFVIGSVVSFFHLPNDTICAYIGDGQVAVLKASNTKNLATWAARNASGGSPSATEDFGNSWANLAALKRAGNALLTRLRADTGASLSIGIGRYHAGVRGLANSYEDARVAVQLGRRFHGHNRVHCLDELGIAGFVGVSDEKTKVELAARLLGPLDHEPDLLTTLDCFFTTNCSPSATARRLTIHRNTLTYRLDKITSLTGLDPRRFDEAVQIRLALLLRSLTSNVPHL